MGRVSFRLTSDGKFVASRSRAEVGISWEPRASLRWNLLVTDVATGARILDSWHPTLDLAFAAAATAVGATRVGWRDLIRVDLGDEAFHRPGNIPAETVLDRFGYVFVDSLQVFAVDSFCESVDARVVRRIFSDRFSCAGGRVGGVKLLGREDGYARWCVDATLPVSGCFHRDRLVDTARDLIEAADAGTLVSCIPVFVSRTRVEQESASVVRFARAS
jgi:hypothetical protein